MKLLTKISYVFIVPLLALSVNAFSQENTDIPVINPPINTELLGSNRGLAFQMIIDKKI